MQYSQQCIGHFGTLLLLYDALLAIVFCHVSCVIAHIISQTFL